MHTQRYACRYNWRSGQRRVLSTCCFQLSQLSHRPLPLLPLCHVGQGVLCQEPVARLSDGKELGTVRLNRCSANAGFLRGQSVAGQGYHDLRIYCARSTQCFSNVSSATGPRHLPPHPLHPSLSEASPSTAGGVLTPTSEVCTSEAYPRSEKAALSSGNRAQSLPHKTVPPSTHSWPPLLTEPCWLSTAEMFCIEAG